jgi:hypothetical protein
LWAYSLLVLSATVEVNVHLLKQEVGEERRKEEREMERKNEKGMKCNKEEGKKVQNK